MGSSNGKVDPQEGDDEFDGPTDDRTCTDVAWLVLKFIFLAGLVGIIGHCIVNGDLYRLKNGYDNCGNVCGRKNRPDPNFQCTGEDMTKKPYLLITEAHKAVYTPKNIHKMCVANCSVVPGYMKFLNRCIPDLNSDVNKEEKKKGVDPIVSNTGLKDFFNEVSEDLERTWPTIVIMCLLALGLSILILVAFRYFAAFIVWFIMIASVVISLGASIFFWYKYADLSKRRGETAYIDQKIKTYSDGGIFFTLATIVILLIILIFRKRIKLVVLLFKEASKASGDLPLLMAQPIITFLAMGLTMFLFVYFTLWIQSAGKLHEGEEDFKFYYYKKDAAMKIGRWYNLFAMYWFIQFLVGCQHMIIAGSVATWYFTRDKSNVGSPIQTAWYNLVRYHLGSVALGSLIIALIQFIRTVIKMSRESMKNNENQVARCVYGCIDCCFKNVEQFLSYLGRNAYIEIAIFGCSFCEGGRMAIKQLINNAFSVVAVNTVGDFVLFLSKVFVVLVIGLISTLIISNLTGIQYTWLPIVIICLFSYFVAHCFITVYEMIIDTIFLCFCEDCEINDGVSKPYFMNKGLMEFVVHSKKVLKVGDAVSGSPDK